MLQHGWNIHKMFLQAAGRRASVSRDAMRGTARGMEENPGLKNTSATVSVKPTTSVELHPKKL